MKKYPPNIVKDSPQHLSGREFVHGSLKSLSFFRLLTRPTFLIRWASRAANFLASESRMKYGKSDGTSIFSAFRSAHVFLLLALQASKLSAEPTSIGFPLPEKLPKSSLEETGVFIIDPQRLSQQPWWTIKDRQVGSPWWQEGARQQYEAIAAFKYYESTILLPQLVKGFDSQIALERHLLITGDSEFTRQQRAEIVMKEWQRLKKVDWPSQRWLEICRLMGSEYDFQKKGFSFRFGWAKTMEIKIANGAPECGLILEKPEIGIRAASSQTFTPVEYNGKAAKRIEMASEVFVEVDEKTAAKWVTSMGTERIAYLVSWVMPSHFLGVHGAGSDNPCTSFALLLQRETSALFIPETSGASNENFINATSWKLGDQRIRFPRGTKSGSGGFGFNYPVTDILPIGSVSDSTHPKDADNAGKSKSGIKAQIK